MDDSDVEGTNMLKEQHEASFAAACTACRALRDLSALSKDFAAVVTDDILRVNSQWSTCVVEGSGYDCSSGGLISDLLILLKHANEAESAIYKAPRRGKRRASFSLSSRRKRKGKLGLTMLSVRCFLNHSDLALELCRGSPTLRTVRDTALTRDGCG